MAPDMAIAYVAHTDRATFFLDANGICRHVLPTPLPPCPRAIDLREKEAAERCLSAQYVASIDTKAKGGLVDLPRVGVPLLFAIASASGRISLIRTAPLLRFEVRPQTPQTPFTPSTLRPRGPHDSAASEFERQVNDSGYAPRVPPPPYSSGTLPRCDVPNLFDEDDDEDSEGALATRVFDQESVLDHHEAMLRAMRRRNAVVPPPIPHAPRQPVHVPAPPASQFSVRQVHKKKIV